MLKVKFNKPVKYNKVVHPANTVFEIDEKDKNEMIAKGAFIIQEAEPGVTPQKVLGNVNPDAGQGEGSGKKDPVVEKPNYKKLGADALKAEFTARGIDQAELTNNEKRIARLEQDDAEKAEAAEFEALKAEAEELEVEVLEDDTLESLQAKVDAKKAE